MIGSKGSEELIYVRPTLEVGRYAQVRTKESMVISSDRKTHLKGCCIADWMETTPGDITLISSSTWATSRRNLFAFVA
jgi:hypothetical protein